jgi:hypothetical protein
MVLLKLANISIVSFLHTLISAIVTFFRSITLQNVIDGLNAIFQAIFIKFPQLLWVGLKALGRGIQVTLVNFFGIIYWIVAFVIEALVWVVLYVPKKVGSIVKSIAGAVVHTFRELWLWISPKSMA